jgi:predicted transcriptional regulator
MMFSNDPLLPFVARIVCAHVEHNQVTAGALPGLIRDVYQALSGVGAGDEASPVRSEATHATPRRSPAGQTVFDDHLVCLECGLHMKMLKRHLQTVHQQSPAQYRAKWRLPGDYPLVARQYAALRSNLAKESGLGKRPEARRR